MANRVLIVGAEGTLGTALARAFRQAGWNVDRYHPGSDMTIAARGVRWIVNAQDAGAARQAGISELTEALLEAARHNSASLLQRGEVLVYGTAAPPWGHATPHRTNTALGRQLAEMEARLREAAAQMNTAVVVLRAGELVQAEAAAPLMNRLILSEIERGRIITPGPPDLPRVHADVDDLCEIALGLAETADALPGFLELGFPAPGFQQMRLQPKPRGKRRAGLRSWPFRGWRCAWPRCCGPRRARRLKPAISFSSHKK